MLLLKLLALVQKKAGIGIPSSLGSLISSGGTRPFTTTGAIIAGNLVVVAFGVNSGGVASVSDGTNTYTKAKYIQNNSTYTSYELWYCANANAVSSGATVNWTGGDGSNNVNGVVMAQVSGIATSSPYDSFASSSGFVNNATSITVTTGTLANANEIIFAGSYLDTNTTANQFAEDPTFTNIASRQASYTAISLGYKIVSSTTAVSYVPTFSPAGAYWATASTPFKKG